MKMQYVLVGGVLLLSAFVVYGIATKSLAIAFGHNAREIAFSRLRDDCESKFVIDFSVTALGVAPPWMD